MAEKHPEWWRSSITTPEEARQAFELVSDFVDNLLPTARDALFAALDETQLSRPATVVEWGRTARFLLVASGPWWARIWAQVVSREYRKTRQELNAPSSLSLAQELLSRSKESVNALIAGFSSLAAVAGIDDLDVMSHTDLASTLNRMVSGRIAVANLPRIGKLEAQFETAGIENVIEQVGKDIPQGVWCARCRIRVAGTDS